MKCPRCPIPGCNFRYASDAATGWPKHIAAHGTHPSWHHAGDSWAETVARFKAEFPAFIASQTTGSRPTPVPDAPPTIPAPPPTHESGTHRLDRDALLAGIRGLQQAVDGL